MPSQQPANLSFSVRKQQEWGSFKDEIRQLYMVQDMTLKQTIEKIKDNHGINAKSILKLKERTWKKKLVEEWGFEKYVPANEMEFIVSKSEKRSREDGKETVFFRGEIQITSESERIVHFKRRKLTHAAATALDSAGRYLLLYSMNHRQTSNCPNQKHHQTLPTIPLSLLQNHQSMTGMILVK